MSAGFQLCSASWDQARHLCLRRYVCRVGPDTITEGIRVMRAGTWGKPHPASYFWQPAASGCLEGLGVEKASVRGRGREDSGQARLGTSLREVSPWPWNHLP